MFSYERNELTNHAEHFQFAVLRINCKFLRHDISNAKICTNGTTNARFLLAPVQPSYHRTRANFDTRYYILQTTITTTTATVLDFYYDTINIYTSTGFIYRY